MIRTIPMTTGLDRPVKRTTNESYRELRRESALECTREVIEQSFSGQGCQDIYPGGHPLREPQQ